ncbi:MAG: hypothetical protein R2703_02645 [Micropruina glycogenica]
MALLTGVSNGGSIEPVVFADDLDIGVVGFLGVARADDWDLPRVSPSTPVICLTGLLPIADAEGGNLVCTEVSGGRIGSIWFWDHEREVNAARRVATSLDAVHRRSRVVPITSTLPPKVKVSAHQPGFPCKAQA